SAAVVRAASSNSDGRAAGAPVPSACALAPSDESIPGLHFIPRSVQVRRQPLPNSVAGGHNRTCHSALPALAAGVRGLCTSSGLAPSPELAEALLTRNERDERARSGHSWSTTGANGPFGERR